MLSNIGSGRRGLRGGMGWTCGDLQLPLLPAHLIDTGYKGEAEANERQEHRAVPITSEPA